MLKSAASAVVLVCVIVVVTSVGAVALRLYCLACRAWRPWGALVIHVRGGRSRPAGSSSGYAAEPATRWVSSQIARAISRRADAYCR